MGEKTKGALAQKALTKKRPLAQDKDFLERFYKLGTTTSERIFRLLHFDIKMVSDKPTDISYTYILNNVLVSILHIKASLYSIVSTLSMNLIRE